MVFERAGRVAREKRATALRYLASAAHKAVAEIPRRFDLERLEERQLLTTALHFAPTRLLGSGIYEATAKGALANTGDSASFSLTLSSPEHLSIGLVPQDGSLVGQIDILSGDGQTTISSATSADPGRAVNLQEIALGSGTYLINATAVGGNGVFKLQADLNAVLDDRSFGSGDNTSTNSAQDLTPSSRALGSGADILTAVGRTPNPPQYYSFHLDAGQFASFALASQYPGGGGHFQPFQSLQAATTPQTVAAADLNGDGAPDLMVGGQDDQGAGRLSVLLNDGNGNFDQNGRVDYDFGRPVTRIATGDVNGDGNLDIIAASSDGLNFGFTVLMSNGDGTFNPGPTYGLNGEPVGIVSADFGDGRTEFAIAQNAADHTHVDIFQSDDFKNVTDMRSLDTDVRPSGLAAGDFNGDGAIDLVLSVAAPEVGNPVGTTTLELFVNDNSGDDSFADAQFLDFGSFAVDVGVGDFDHSNLDDIVFLPADSSDGQLHVQTLMNDGTGNFTDAQNLGNFRDTNIGSGSWLLGARLALGDITGDGFLDLIATNTDDNGSVITTSNGEDGNFYGSDSFGFGQAVRGVATADLAGTGQAGLIFAMPDGNLVEYAQGRGNVGLVLMDAQGNSIAQGANHEDVDSEITQFVAPVSGTYYLQVSGDPFQPYSLAVTRGARLRAAPDQIYGLAQDLSLSKSVTGYLDADNGGTQSFSLGANDGDVITLTTSTPANSPDGDPMDLFISLFDSSGHLLASDNNSAPDGVNATLQYAVPAGGGGQYSVVISAISGKGEYVLASTGAHYISHPLTVTFDSIPDNSIQSSFPSFITFTFSDEILFDSTAAQSILINGKHPANVYRFDHGIFVDTNGTFTGDGTYTITLPAGALKSTIGEPLQAFSSSFLAETDGPRISSATITDGQVFTTNDSISNTIHFDKGALSFSYLGIFGFTYFGPNSVILRNATTGQIIPVTGFIQPEGETDFVSGPESGGTTVDAITATYGKLPEGLYEFRIKDSILDRYFKPLDGDGTSLPSGDGQPGGDYVVHFEVDAPGTVVMPNLAQSAPLGSQLREAAASGAFGNAADSDAFSFNAGPGQTVTVVITPTGGTPTIKVTLKDPGGSALATTTGSAGQGVILQNIPTTTGGTYNILLDSLGLVGAFSVRVILNGSAQPSTALLAPNSSPASAFDLSSSFKAMVGGSDLASVVGNATAGNTDYYAVNLLAGQTISAMLGAQGPDGALAGPSTLSFTLRDSNGTVLAAGAPVAAAATLALPDFVVNAGGVYYLTVSGSGAYGLTITRGASLNVAVADPNAGPQDITRTGIVAGYLVHGGLSGPIRIAELVTSINQNPDPLAAELSADGAVVTVVTADQVDTLDKLNAFDVLLFNGGTNNTKFATALAEWVFQGHSVVVTPRFYNGVSNDVLAILDPVVPFPFAGPAIGPVAGTFVATSINSPITANVNPGFVNAGYAPGVDPAASVLATVNGRPVVISNSVGNLGRTVFLGVDYISGASGALDQLLTQALTWGAQGGAVAGNYSVNASAGDHLTISTTTPGDNGGSLGNQLDPVVQLFNPQGQLVASSDNGAADNRNAKLTYIVPAGADGAYRIIVSAAGSAGGDYVLRVQGATSTPAVISSSVTSTVPDAGSLFRIAPTTIDLVFSRPLRADSVSAADLMLTNGATATAVQVIDGTTLRFTISVPVVAGQLVNYTFSVAAGAFSDLQGNPSAGYSSNFQVDTVGPRVLSTTPQNQGSAPFKQISFRFSKPIDPNTVEFGGQKVTGPNGVFFVNGVVVSGDTVTFFLPTQLTPGIYTMVIGPNYTDLLGNKMDQDGNGTNGQATDTYTAVINLASPNLTPQSISTASSALFGSSVNVQWTVKNTGSDPTANNWSDKIYLSPTATFDPATAILLGTYPRPNSLGVNESYTQNQTIALPAPGFYNAGDYHLILVSDSTNTQPEADETDNTLASSIISLTQPILPDLTPVQVTAPAQATYGTTITIAWKDANIGQADFNGSVVDAIYLSTSPTRPENATFFGTLGFVGSIPIGGSVDRAAQITLPNRVGNLYVLIVHDSTGIVTENNENNNTGATLINIVPPPMPDLAITNITMPATATSGGNLPVTFTITNNGQIDFNGSFSDAFFITPFTTIDGISFVTQLDFTGFIPVGGQITVTRQIPIGVQVHGNRWVVVTADQNGTVAESNESNNASISVLPVNFVYPPLPDLTPSNITQSPTATSGRGLTVTWTDTNSGDADFTGVFTDYVYISSDNAIGGDQLLGTFTFTGSLAAGASVQRTQTIQLPPALQGQTWIVVQTDGNGDVFEGNESNNNAISASPVTVALSPFPDLVVSNLVGPSTVFSDQDTQVSWTVENHGNGSTDSQQWNDKIYLSPTPALDGRSILLATVPNASFLNAGDLYKNTATVHTPLGLFGTYYIIVKADANDNVLELNGEGNNIAVTDAVNVQLTPPPNIQVGSISVPGNIFSGQPVVLRYTIVNSGPGPTRAAESVFGEEIFISPHPTFDGSAQYLTTLFHTGGLASGQSYTNTVTVNVPVGISGTYYVIIQADYSNQVFEVGFENDNFSSVATNVLLTPPPDLVTNAVVAPATAQASHNLHVTYTVTNTGSTATPNNDWTDRLYLSPTRTFDSATAIFMADKGHFGMLTVSGATRSYTGTFDATIPDGLSGTYYAIVVSDVFNQVFELDNNNNFGSAAATAIVSLPADLTANITSAPASINTSQPLNVTFTVQNIGAGDTAAGQWNDRLILYTDPVMGNGIEAASWFFFHQGLLSPGQFYTVNASNLTVPSYVAPGTYYLFVSTDSQRDVYEGAPGSAGEVNNLTPPLAIHISRNTASLEVQQITAPPTALAGTPVALSWTVKNNGDGNANFGYWYDSVYLSTSSTFNAQQVVYLGSVFHVNGLGIGQQYTGSGVFSIPAGLSGDFYVIVVSDAENRVTESPDRINGTRASTSPISISPNLADLKVTSITAPANATAGLQAQVSWTVKNIGTGSAISPYSSQWYDTLYLSTDANLDPAHAIPIGTYAHAGALAAGGQYTVSTFVQLPNGLSGPYYFIVVTDSNSRVVEGAGELNNSTSAPVTQFHLQPPIDLVAGTLTIPANGGAGQGATLTYTVTNNSVQTAFGGWQDAFYLSPTPAFDPKTAVFFAQKQHTDALLGNSSYTDTVFGTLPGLVPGTYYVILRTDIKDTIPETDKNNNISASLTGIAVDVPILTIGNPESSNLGGGQSLFYRVVVGAGESLVINLAGTSPSSSNQLFASFGKVPTPADHDYQYSSAISASQRIIIPSTQAGTYYILVRGASVTDANPVTITATVPQFSVVDTNFGIGGTGGNLTLQINGTKFDRTAIASLHLPGGATVPASAYYYINETRFYATFNLLGATPGVYDVNVSDGHGNAVTVSGGLKVVHSAPPAAITPIILGPQFISAGMNFDFRVVWANPALNDAPAPLLDVLSTRPFSEVPSSSYDHTSTEFYGAADNDGPPGILRPNQTIGRNFFTKGGNGFELLLAVDITAGEPYATFADPFDWESLYADMIPDGMSDARFKPIFDRIVQENGSTWGGYLNMLSRNANLLVDALGEPDDALNMLALEVRRVQAELGTSISGKVFNSSFSVDIAGRPVQAKNLDDGQKFSTIAMRDGSFVFENLTPGRYTITTLPNLPGSSVSVVVGNGQAVTGVQLNVVAGAAITGKVTSQAPGGPLDGAIVVATLSDGSVFAAQTGEDGSYAFNGIPAGTYSITASNAGYARQTIDSVTVAVNGTATKNFALAGGGAVKGVVTTSDGAAVNSTIHADAYLGGDLTSSAFFLGHFNAQQFAISDLPPGKYTIVVSQDNYVPVAIPNVVVSAGGTFDVGTVTLQRATLVSGVLTSSVPSSPASRVIIAAMKNGKDVSYTSTRSDGTFNFTDLAPGSYVLEARPTDGSLSTQAGITLVAGEQDAVASLSIVSGATIVATVIRNSDNATLPGISVTLSDASGKIIVARTDSAGKAHFSGLKPGDYMLVAGNQASSVQAVNVSSLTSSLTRQLVVTDNISASLSGHLTSAGNPVSGAAVGLFYAGQMVDSTTTNSDGIYQFTIHATGEYELDATATNVAFAPISGIIIGNGQHISRDLTAGSSSLQVTLTGASGSGAIVALIGNTLGSGEKIVEQMTADASGIVHFSGLFDGNYRVLVNGVPGFTAVQNVTVSGASSVNVTLVRGDVVSGVVVDQASGQPVAGALLELYSSDHKVDVNFVTDSDGSYILPGVPAGNYVLSVLFDGYISHQQAVVVSGDVTANVALQAGAPDITGRVVDGGSPVANASVYVVDASGTVLGLAATDGNGNFTIRTAKGSDLTIIIAPFGYEQQRLLHVDSSAGSVALGNIAVQLVAASSTPPDSAAPAPLPQVPVAAPAPLPSGPVGGPSLPPANTNSTPAWYPLTIDGVVSAVNYSDIPLLPRECRATCLAAYVQALRAQAQQQALIQQLNDAREKVNSEQHRAIIVYALEFTENLGVLASLGLAIGPYAEAAATNYVASTFLGGAAAASYGLSLLQGIYLVGKQIVDSVHAPSPSSQLDAWDNATSLFSNIRTGLVGFVGIFAQENFSKPVFSPGGATAKIGLLGLFNLHNIINTFRFSGTQDALKDVIDVQNTAETVHDLALNAVLRAKRALDAYKACLKNCEKEIQKTHPDFVLHIRYPASEDPNDLNGPAGFGPNQYITATKPLDYVVHFENKPQATAPAQHVHISIPLDQNLDARTFRLGDMTIADQIISVGDAAFYQGQLDLTATDGVLVNIVAGVDIATHTAFWDFQAIDPNTGLAPSNPTIGFLPPDVDGLVGQGSVHYSISAADGVQSGQTVSAQATISFDNNSPLDTNLWSNTFDATAPTSLVAPLDSITQTNSFRVTWAGTDDNSGSGVAKFNVYVSIDGGDYQLWLAATDATSAIYTGNTPHTYAFYSVALDNAGNEEGAHVQADAQTTIFYTSVSGFLFNDTNNNGVKDSSEAGLSGWTVYLDPIAGTPGSQLSTTTDDQGNYSFFGIAPGSYTVHQQLQSGYARTAPGSDSVDVSVADGHAVTGPDFGDVLISSVTLDFNLLVKLAQNYDKPATFAGGDLNGDGKVNFIDLVLLAQNYGKKLPQAAAVPAPAAIAGATAPVSAPPEESPVQSTPIATASNAPSLSVSPTAAPNPAKIFNSTSVPSRRQHIPNRQETISKPAKNTAPARKGKSVFNNKPVSRALTNSSVQLPVAYPPHNELAATSRTNKDLFDK